MSKLKDYLERLQTGANESHKLSNLPGWITDNTYLKGAKFSFKGREYQRKIIEDESQEVHIVKSSQTGVSEIFARWALGLSETFPSVSTIFSMPAASEVRAFCKTRVDPVIASSPRLSSAVSSDVNSSEVIKIHDSLLYFRGCNSITSAISVPADTYIADEVDRSDELVLTQFISRLSASKMQLKRYISTPTLPGYGISLMAETARRFKAFIKCEHCNEYFLPEYKHVQIPDFRGDLESLTKSNLTSTRYLDAALHCPACGKIPDRSAEHQHWVQENPDSNFEPASYFITPWMVPSFREVPTIIRESTQYFARSEWEQQCLGIASSQGSESLTLEDLRNSKTTTDLYSSSAHCLGLDVGVICHATVGRLTAEGQLLIVHRQKFPISSLEQVKNQLKAKYRALVTVIDGQPFTSEVARLQRTDKSVYGANFSVAKSAPVYSIKMYDGLESEGKLPIHQAKISRDRAFDQLLDMYKRKEVVTYIQDEALDDEADKHALSVKRVQKVTDLEGLTYVWQKTDGNDDWLFSQLFLLAACRLRGEVGNQTPLLGGGRSIMGSFKLKA